jgi:excisionase family DNA binding protein
MPLLEGWATSDRTLLLYVDRGLKLVEKELAVDGVDLPVPVLRARVEIAAYIKRGSTAVNASTSQSDICGPVADAVLGQIDTLDSVSTAHLLRVTDRTVRRKCQKGEIPSLKVGKEWRIDRVAVEAMQREKVRPS